MNFNKSKYKVYTWKSWMVLHWILNPAFAINELFFGQRVPKISLEDITSDKQKFERSLVPCPHCHTLHDGRTWSTETGTAFKNWFGLYCTNCGGIIPCITNALSFIILLLTFPIWVWFRKSLKEKWLANQPKRFENIDFEQIYNPYDSKNWIKTGLAYGILMFVFVSIVLPFFKGDEITLRSLTIGVIWWIIGGLIFGFVMKVWMSSKIKNIKV